MSVLLGLGPKTAATQPQRANGVQINASDYGKVLPLVYGRARVPGICLWYGDFKSTENKQQTGKGGGSSISYTYSFSFALAFCEGPVTGVRSWWINSAKVTDVPDVVRLGTAGQATWSHWGADALNGPALTYPYVCWAGWLNWNAGSSPNTPQVNAEIDGLLQYNAGGGIYGAEPSAILADILGAGVHGSNWPWLGDLTQFRDYCVANSLFLSPVVDTETALSDLVNTLLQITNTQPVWDGGALQLMPMSDETITANGITFTPDETVAADLGPDDFMGETVEVDRKPDGDVYNVVRVEWVNAAANYVTSVAEAKDLSHISDHGEQAMETIQAHAITDPAIAAQVARTILDQQLYIRNTYTFPVGIEQIALRPMMKVTLTDPLAELDHVPVRIVSIEENGDDIFQVVAEEFPAGVSQGAAHALEAHAGFVPAAEAAPDTTAAPVFFRAPPGLSGVAGTPAAWVGAAGSGPNWGGANVWASLDGVSYSWIGLVRPGARYGTLKTALGAGADPDAVNSCELTLIGPGQLNGGSNGDADNGVTLLLIDQELVGYSATVLNGDGSYTIGGNYLRRGMYGTQISAHAIDAPWLRVDDNFFAWTFAHEDVGKTVHLKFQAFNLYGGGTEDLSTVPAYDYVLGSAAEVPDTPPAPSGPTVLPIADGITLFWVNSNPAAVAMTAVEVSPDGATWSALGQTAGTFYTHHFSDGKTYYYRMRARSAAFLWSGYSATISSTGKIVEDGATKGATIGPGGNVDGAVDPNGRAVVDLSQGGHLNKNLDNVADGTGRYAAAEAGADVTGNRIADLSPQLLPNWNFKVKNGAGRPAGIIGVQGDDGGLQNYIAYGDIGISIAAGGLYGYGFPAIPIDYQQQYEVTITHRSSAAAAAGLYLRLIELNSALPTGDTHVGVDVGAPVAQYTSYVDLVSGGAMPGAATVTQTFTYIPGAGTKMVSFALYNWGSGVTYYVADVQIKLIPKTQDSVPDGSTYGRALAARLSSGNPLIDFSANYHLNKNLDNIGDGTGYARILTSQLTGGVHKLGIAGSGVQLGGTRNQKPVTIGNFGSVWSGLSISYTASAGSPATATISASATTLQAGSASVSYNASSVSVSGTGGTNAAYYLYFDDPSYSGGTQTLVATTSLTTALSGDGYVYLGTCTVNFPSSGSGSGGGGGAGGSCVTVDSVLPGYGRAADVTVGDRLELGNPVTFERRQGLVSCAKTETVPCVRFTTESGISLECSETAPIAVHDGKTVLAPALLGCRIPVWDFGEWRIERVAAVESIGPRAVRHITCEDDLFLAGAQRHRYVLHHNIKP